ncbi:tyrosine--tRNA ligase [Lawsonella clevelandensis]|uniref:tyrosine--tRNA ligase n=1 Tax=Lawsonella clevelandensis TaxID=1528099 RepID=UPI0032D903FD
MDNIIDELTWRGLIQQSTDIDELRDAINDGPITLYCGFDPTGPSLHAGHLIPLLLLRRFQKAGHRPIVMAGGATGLIGDPRDVGERVMNSEDTVADWAERIKNQLERFVTFDDSETGAIVENNMHWVGEMSAIDFLRGLGKSFSLNTMLSRETVKRRLETDGISYTEFSYMILQANDFVELNRRYGCVLQVGGSDQWGNIVAGIDLNRRVNNAKVHGITVPLVTSSDGKKFGKSTGGGSLWLDPEMTSPYKWYQYFLNTNDADVIKYLRWFTFLTKEELDELAAEVEANPGARKAQRCLADEMTTLVHGIVATEAVKAASAALFGKGDLRALDGATLGAALQEAGAIDIDKDMGVTIVDLLIETGLCSSKGEARRTLKEGGCSVNNERINDESWIPAGADLLPGNWLLVRRGKKNVRGVHIR